MKKFAFTMAEILISLTIIGIIAAITLPALQGNINEKTWATQRKALYSRMTQAISMMPALNGYGFSDNEATTANIATQEFIAELGKVLKINNVCDGDHLTDCGIKEEDTHVVKLNNLSGSQVEVNVQNLLSYMTYNFGGTPVPATDLHNYAVQKGGLETANGESMLVFYNPYCVGSNHNETVNSLNHMYNKVCVSFLFDLNGTKGPNTMGKDMGIITALYASDSVVVAPLPLATNAATGKNYSDAMAACRTQDEDSRLPNLEEGIAMAYNAKMLNGGTTNGTLYWTNSNVSADNAWVVMGGTSKQYKPVVKTTTSNTAAWCVKR